MHYIWSDFTDLSMNSASIAVLIGALLTMASVLFGAKYKQGKGTELSVFKGREAKLNRTIFQTLTAKGPQTIYDIHKHIRAVRELRNTRYASVNKRIKVLEESGYVKKAPVRKTKSGFQTTIYESTIRARLGMLLDTTRLEDLIMHVDEEAATIVFRELLRTIKKEP